jgi:hypothetical protein
MDLNRIPSLIAFCDTAPGERFSLLAIVGQDSRCFANCLRPLTSVEDHGRRIARFVFLRMEAPESN